MTTSPISRDSYLKALTWMQLRVTVLAVLITVGAVVPLELCDITPQSLARLAGSDDAGQQRLVWSVLFMLIYVMPLFLIVACGIWLDRRSGMHCPKCGYSLTLRVSPERVLSNGECPRCGTKVFPDVDE